MERQDRRRQRKEHEMEERKQRKWSRKQTRYFDELREQKHESSNFGEARQALRRKQFVFDRHGQMGQEEEEEDAGGGRT